MPMALNDAGCSCQRPTYTAGRKFLPTTRALGTRLDVVVNGKTGTRPVLVHTTVAFGGNG